MTRNALICLLALFLVATAHADTLKDVLNHQYKNHILALRSPFTAGDQEFDSAGQPLNSSPPGLWPLWRNLGGKAEPLS